MYGDYGKCTRYMEVTGRRDLGTEQKERRGHMGRLNDKGNR